MDKVGGMSADLFAGTADTTERLKKLFRDDAEQINRSNLDPDWKAFRVRLLKNINSCLDIALRHFRQAVDKDKGLHLLFKVCEGLWDSDLVKCYSTKYSPELNALGSRATEQLKADVNACIQEQKNDLKQYAYPLIGDGV